MARKTGNMCLEFMPITVTQVIFTPDDVATFYTGKTVLGTIEEVRVHN
jgi:hypothetical protein